MNPNDLPAQLLTPAEFEQCLARQRAAYLADPNPSHAQRVADLKALALMLKENQAALVEAIHRDYTNRSSFETLFAEFFVVLDGIRDTIGKLKRWMKPQRRHVDLMMYPLAKNRLIAQPLGVVGVIVPWNFPLYLSIGPLTAIFAAGNRAMLKMSENSAHLAKLLIELSPKYFPAEKLSFFEDGGGRGPAFSALPFDHLMFTGSGQTGRAVMASAARNLTPVTLELGGKAPAIVGPGFPIKTAAERVLWVKMFNAGQVCLNVDYLFLPEGKVGEFVEHARRLVAERYPDLNGPDFTSIIDERSFQRLVGMLDDARAKGAHVINLLPHQKPDRALRKFAPHLVLNPSDDMQLSQREIFGPILPIRTYRDSEEVARYINARDRPLAIYPFTHDKALQRFYIDRVMSGGVSVNEAMMHAAQHDLPFGGVGASGMGHYHGYEGFTTFSKLRPVFHQAPFSAIQMMFQPPYGVRAEKIMNWLIRLRG
ncbi:coniferyl aldehyde dehydrogenase [Variovorax sp. LARHSF232]